MIAFANYDQTYLAQQPLGFRAFTNITDLGTRSAFTSVLDLDGLRDFQITRYATACDAHS